MIPPALQIKKRQSPNFCPRNRYGLSKITHLVMHGTEGVFPGSIDWLCNPLSKVSSHYAISRAGDIWQLVDDNQAAWAVMDANGFTLNIELENMFTVVGQLEPVGGSLGRFPWTTPAQMNAATQLAARLCQEYQIPVANIIGHSDPLLKRYGNNHQDPGPLFPMADFRKQVAVMLEQMREPAPPTAVSKRRKM